MQEYECVREYQLVDAAAADRAKLTDPQVFADTQVSPSNASVVHNQSTVITNSWCLLVRKRSALKARALFGINHG